MRDDTLTAARAKLATEIGVLRQENCKQKLELKRCGEELERHTDAGSGSGNGYPNGSGHRGATDGDSDGEGDNGSGSGSDIDSDGDGGGGGGGGGDGNKDGGVDDDGGGGGTNRGSVRSAGSLGGSRASWGGSPGLPVQRRKRTIGSWSPSESRSESRSEEQLAEQTKVLSELELRVMSMEREREDMVAAALHSEREKEALKELLEEERDIAESLRGTNHDLSQALYEDDGRYPTALRQGLDDGHVSDGEEYGTSPRLSSAAIIDMRDPSHLSIGDVAASHVPVPSSPSSPPPFKDEASALAAGKTQAEIDAWKKSHHVDDEDEDEDGASQVQVKGQVEEPAPAAPVVSAEAKGRWGKVAAVAPSRLRKRRTSVARMEFID